MVEASGGAIRHGITQLVAYDLSISGKPYWGQGGKIFYVAGLHSEFYAQEVGFAAHGRVDDQLQGVGKNCRLRDRQVLVQRLFPAPSLGRIQLKK
ncbi:hypothetical protein [Rhizobium sp. Root1203]|uniref:hypothetical protein n=1 Tax=Rhizobium sp. Root1203 TaxID=1736427 RepID=UPI00138F0B16|nr:hypothetical protein [Rhizobium sp. Root1203]